MKRVHSAILLWLLAIVGVAGQAPQPQDGGPAVAEFERRVAAYVALRDGIAKGAAELNETPSPEEIVAAELALAARIRDARSDARRGDLFTPEMQAHVRRVMKPEMQGLRGRNTRGIIRDEGPVPEAVPVVVNAAYPKDQPRGTVPANILELLPRLPEGLEYRFVDTTLVLRDTRANLIVDYMPDAMS